MPHSPRCSEAAGATVDDRDFRVYLVAFVTDTIEVGISADERLPKEGATAFAWIVQGSHDVGPAVEIAIATAGLVLGERQRAAKISAGTPSAVPDRRAALEKVAAAARQFLGQLRSKSAARQLGGRLLVGRRDGDLNVGCVESHGSQRRAPGSQITLVVWPVHTARSPHVWALGAGQGRRGRPGCRDSDVGDLVNADPRVAVTD